MWAEGASVKAIARALRRPPSTISGVVSRDRERFPRRKLRDATEADRATMRAMRAEGYSCKAVAEALGLARGTVYRYWRGDA